MSLDAKHPTPTEDISGTFQRSTHLPDVAIVKDVLGTAVVRSRRQASHEATF